MSIEEIIEKKAVIHCSTKKSAETLCECLSLMGLTWISGKPYTETHYDEFGAKTCYDVADGTKATKSFYESKGRKIVNFDDITLIYK